MLCQIRGIGRYTAMLVIAEVGDIQRFRSARKLCAWAGLTPDRPQLRRQSPPRAQHQTRLAAAALGLGQGSPTNAGRGGGPLRDSYERIAKRRGRKIAKVAVARKILTLCYYGLRDGEIRCLARRCRSTNTESQVVAASPSSRPPTP